MRIRYAFAAWVGVLAAGCSYKPETATFTEPSKYGITISITRQLMNPFTNGYGRFVSINHEGPHGMSATLHTIDDVLGSGPVNLYRTEGPKLLLLGNIERVVVDLKTGSSGSVPLDTKHSGEFLGSFDEDPGGAWRFISASERAELPVP
jgi:hypothetical protein